MVCKSGCTVLTGYQSARMFILCGLRSNFEEVTVTARAEMSAEAVGIIYMCWICRCEDLPGWAVIGGFWWACERSLTLLHAWSTSEDLNFAW